MTDLREKLAAALCGVDVSVDLLDADNPVDAILPVIESELAACEQQVYDQRDSAWSNDIGSVLVGYKVPQTPNEAATYICTWYEARVKEWGDIQRRNALAEAEQHEQLAVAGAYLAAAAEEAAREVCCSQLELREDDLRHIAMNDSGRKGIEAASRANELAENVKAIRALNVTGALQRALDEANLQEAKWRLNHWPPLGALQSVDSLRQWIQDRQDEASARIVQLEAKLK